jgi:hypothetical protein
MKEPETHLWVEIALAGDGFPTAEELAARNGIIDSVEEQGLGHVTGSGGGLGAMDFSVRVASEHTAKDRIAALIREVLPERRFEIRRMG